MTAAAVTAASSMESAASVEASAKAGLPAGRKAPRDSSVIEAAECTGMRARLRMRCESMWATGESPRSGSMKSTGAIEVVAIDENSAVGNVAVVVEENSMTTPVVSPVSPAPAKSAKEADSKAQAKRDSRAAKIESRI